MKCVVDLEVVNKMKFDFEKLLTYLGRPATGPDIIELVGRQPEAIERFEHLAFVEFKPQGVSVMFREIETRGVRALFLSTFHLHRAGHEAYSQYNGNFPNQVDFNDTEQVVLTKLGKPESKGGGGFSKVLKKPIPNWVRYFYKNGVFQIQLDDQRKIEMVSLFDPNLVQIAMSRQH